LYKQSGCDPPTPLTGLNGGRDNLGFVRRLAFWLAAGSLVLGACSGSTSDSPTTLPDASGDTAPETTTSLAVPDTTVAPTTTHSGRPVAPDFTLELGDGGTYTLSEGAKPVYLVFWAEW
jgi:hypothetical protein